MIALYTFQAHSRHHAMEFLSIATSLTVLPALTTVSLGNIVGQDRVDVTFQAADVRLDLLQKVARSLFRQEIADSLVAKPVVQGGVL